LSFDRRPCASADAVTNALVCEGHNLPADEAVQLWTGGAGALPAGLAAGVVYYVRPVAGSTSLFQLALTAGGAAIDITTAGTAPFGFIQQINATILRALDYRSRWIDRNLTGHLVPASAPYPTELVTLCCRLAAWDVALELGKGKKDDPLSLRFDQCMADVAQMKKGQPLRDGAARAPANAAISAVSALSAGSWVRTDGSLP
jgi:hypothetical protein